MNLPGSETAGNITPLQVADWLRLFIEPGQVSELRALEVVEGRYRTPVIAGFYDHEHLDEMAAAALKLSPRAKGVYFVLNPLKPQILCRRANRVDKAGTGDLAGDGHVERRKFLLVDVDPVRLDGISATDEEKEAARTVMKRLVDYLRSVGWPEPIFADSGNGYHALPYIDLPAADGDLVKGVLRASPRSSTRTWRRSTRRFLTRLASSRCTARFPGKEIPQTSGRIGHRLYYKFPKIACRCPRIYLRPLPRNFKNRQSL